MMKKKLKNRKGFTLVELLFALLITSFAGMLALGGIMVGANAYRDIILKSQGQMLMKEYMDSFRSILSAVSPDSGIGICFEMDSTGSTERVYLPSEKLECAGYFNDDGGIIYFQPVDWSKDHGVNPSTGHRFDDAKDSSDNIQHVDLVTRRTASGFTAELIDFTYDKGLFTGTIKLTSTSNLSSGDPLTLTERFSIYPLNYHN